MKKTLAEKFVSWPDWKKNSFIILMVGVVGTLCLTPFIFYSNPGVPFGFFIGVCVSILAYLSICYYGYNIVASSEGVSKTGGTALSVAFNLGRFLLYAGILVIAALCTFRWNNNWFNFWGVAAGYLPMPVILGTVSLIKNRKGAPETIIPDDPSMHIDEDEPSNEKESKEAQLEKLKAQNKALEEKIKKLEEENRDA